MSTLQQFVRYLLYYQNQIAINCQFKTDIRLMADCLMVIFMAGFSNSVLNNLIL